MGTYASADRKYRLLAEFYGYETEYSFYLGEYVDNNKSSKELALMLGVSDCTVRVRLHKYGIPLKHRGGANHIKRADIGPVKMCSNCGDRAVPEGNRCLCKTCYEEVIYERGFEMCG